MRIWDITPSKLCRNHLLGEHRELHAMWTIITESKKGYLMHPGTIRWKGKLKVMYLRHEELVAEMVKRGYNHRSPLDKRKATGKSKQDIFVDRPEKQAQILRQKRCCCKI